MFPEIEEEQEILPELSDRYNDDSNDDNVYEGDEVEDIPEPVIQKARSGRVTWPPNNLEPHHGPRRQDHGNIHDTGVNLPLIENFSGSEGDRVECQYTSASYTTR